MTALVLVTGGTGYVAGWCIVRALQAGFEVRSTVRSSAKADQVRHAVSTEVDPGDRLTFAVADLTDDAGWDEAMAGVSDVLHVASPLGSDGRGDEASLVQPAREGTSRVLSAAHRAGVRRVVVTSSGAAATPTAKGDVVTDDRLWTDPEQPGLTAYRKSKVLAERTAWQFAAEHPDLEVATVLPGAIFGPALPGVSQSSTQLLARMMSGRLPAVPRIQLAVSDVRDLAELHLLAMSHPEAAGDRFLGTSEVLTMHQIADILRTELGATAPRRTMPDVVLRVAARFNPELAALVPMLGRRVTASSAHARTVLGWRPRPATETVIDTGNYLLGAAR